MAVQISGNDITVPRDGTFSRNVSIAGTLTYEDVTNVDSIGLVTARNGIEIGARPGVAASISVDGNMIVSGVSTFGENVTIKNAKQLLFENDAENASSAILNLGASGTSNLVFAAGGSERARLESAGNLKIEKNLNVVGVVTATSYEGSGANLTGISVGIATTAASMSGITTVLDLSKDDFKVTASGITTVDVRGGTEGGSHMLRIVNSGITTVGFSTYFLFPSGGTPALPISDGAISLISFTVHRQGAVGLATQLLAGSSVNFS